MWAFTHTSNFTTVLHSSCDRCSISWILICVRRQSTRVRWRISSFVYQNQGRRTRGGCGCFNTHTFRDERVQHPHFFCSFSAVSHKRLTAVAPRFLWPPCVWECARCSCLLSPPSQTWHRLWVWPADDWLFCLKSRLSWCVRFIGQLVLRRRELMVIYISLFQVLWMSVNAFEVFK